MVDHKKQFGDVFVGLLRSMNNFKVLQLSNVYRKVTFDEFFDPEHGSYDGINPYIFGDKNCQLLPWFRIPHKQSVNIKHTFLEALYNRHLSKGGVWWKIPSRY
jgi:hypothetical protein